MVDEIHAYADSPSDHIFDLFDELIFPDHPLGRNILGTPKSVRSFSRGQLLEFTRAFTEPVGSSWPQQVP